MDEKTLNIIIIDDSFDTEEKIVSTLRNQGFAARSTRVEDDEDLIKAIKAREPEVVIYTQGMELITLKQVCDCLKENLNQAPVPVIAVEKGASLEAISEVMRAGAADLSTYTNIHHLALAIKREVTSYRHWKRISILKTAYDESERRCTSLLDSSRDAIAYIHEGMHVYSNESYLEVFGIDQS